MRYVSTRGASPVLDFEAAMLTGLARDGGLYVPEAIPALGGDVARMGGWSYEAVADHVLTPFVGDTFTPAELRGALERAYAGFRHAARAPLVQVAPGHWLLELFHGPTLAFKDFAMQLIGQLFQIALARSGRRVTIVGATSGDTGSAAIEAFRGLPNVDVFILFPHGRVSDVQRRQMTTPTEANVHALALDGTFDDAQARLKDLFNDHAFRDEVGLAGVNSINVARVLAQVVYYVTATAAFGGREVDFTVPTGNFGDILAGSIAKAMGAPVGRLVAATNQNDILDRALRTGRYETRGVAPSISPSMDIEVSSNFERALFDATGRDPQAVAGLMAGLRQSGGFTIPDAALAGLRGVYASGRASEDETRATIAATFAASGEVLCPHTAVGAHVAAAHAREGVPMVTLATAHPAKFPDAVEAATGQRPALPGRLAELLAGDERVTRVPNDAAALAALIRDRRRA